VHASALKNILVEIIKKQKISRNATSMATNDSSQKGSLRNSMPLPCCWIEIHMRAAGGRRWRRQDGT